MDGSQRRKQANLKIIAAIGVGLIFLIIGTPLEVVAIITLVLIGVTSLSTAEIRSADRCLRCGYDLSGHTPGATCPECGTDIRTPQRDLRGECLRSLAWISGCIGIYMALYSAAVLLDHGMGGSRWWFRPFTVAAAIHALWLASILIWLLARQRTFGALKRSSAAALICSITFAVMLCVYQLLILLAVW